MAQEVIQPRSPKPTKDKAAGFVRAAFWFWVWIGGVAFPPVRAHRLDELLQATLIGIETNRVRLECQLTPGVDVAIRVLGDLDVDRDGQISTLEANAFVERFRRELSADLDGAPLQLEVVEDQFDAIPALTNGLGSIHIELQALFPSLSPAPHELHFENHYRTNLSVYLVNALQPESKSIAIDRQHRDELQSRTRIHFRYQPRLDSDSMSSTRSIPTSLSHIWWLVGSVIAAGLVSRRFRTRKE